MSQPVEAYAYDTELLCGQCAETRIANRYNCVGADDVWQSAYQAAVDKYGGDGAQDTANFPQPCFGDDVQLGDQCAWCSEYLRDGIPDGAAEIDSTAAVDWHTGQWSALYSLASTGRVNGFEHQQDLLGEIDDCLARDISGVAEYDVERLVALRRDVEAWPHEAV